MGDIDRARGIFDLAINQTKLDMPEVLWKAYIDFEIEQEEYDRTRALYKCLLQRTQHVKVNIHYSSVVQDCIHLIIILQTQHLPVHIHVPVLPHSDYNFNLTCTRSTPF